MGIISEGKIHLFFFVDDWIDIMGLSEADELIQP